MSKKILFWLGLFVMSLLVMVKPANATLETIAPIMRYEVLHPTNHQACEGQVTATIAYDSPALALAGFSASFPRTCTMSGAPWYNQSAWAFVLTSNTSLTYSVQTPLWYDAQGVMHSANATSGVVKTWSEVNACPVPTTRPEFPYTYNPTTQLCEREITTCPHTYLGIETSGGYVFSTTSHSSYSGCDSYSCEISVEHVSSVFGVSLFHNVPTPRACVNTMAPALTVTITEAQAPTSPEKINFEKVIDKAVPVDPVKTETAKTEASKSVQEVAQHISLLDSSLNDAQAKLAAKKVAAQELQKAASEFIASPSQATLDKYNQRMVDYKNSDSALTPAITKMRSDWETVNAAMRGLQAKRDDSAAVKQQIGDLQGAITASGQQFDQTQVGAKIGDSTGLSAATEALVGALGNAVTRMGAVKSAGDIITTTNNNTNSTVNNTHTVVTTITITNNYPPPPAPPPPPPPPPPTPPPPPDCSVTPNAPGCAPMIDCKMTPNTPQCMAASAVNACELNPLSAGCAELGAVPDDVSLDEKKININTITPVAVGGAGACPAPKSFTLRGKTYYMSFDIVCSYVTGIKPIIIAFAWLIAAGILVGGFRAG